MKKQRVRSFFILICSLLLINITNAQDDCLNQILDHSFENGICVVPAGSCNFNAIGLNCNPPWINAIGTPDVCELYTGYMGLVVAVDGDYFCRMAVNSGGQCEAISQNIILANGQQYDLSYRINKLGGADVVLVVAQASGLSPDVVNGGVADCSLLQSFDIVSQTPVLNASWITITTTIVGNGSDQLLIYPLAASGLADVFVDDVHLSCESLMNVDFSPISSTLETVSFMDLTSSTVSGLDAIEWLWTFPDGSTSSVQNPTHTFAGPGIYEVCLCIKDSNGCKREACINVEINPLSCCEPGGIEIDGSQSLSQLIAGTTLPTNSAFGYCIEVVQNQTFVIDQDYIFSNCHFYMQPGASIDISVGVQVTIEQASIVEGCNGMWDDILVNSTGRLTINGGSVIRDANIGINALTGSTISVEQSFFQDNVRGIVANDATVALLEGNTFECIGSASHCLIGVELMETGARCQNNVYRNMGNGISIDGGILRSLNATHLDLPGSYSGGGGPSTGVPPGGSSNVVGRALSAKNGATVIFSGADGIFGIQRCVTGIFLEKGCALLCTSAGMVEVQNGIMSLQSRFFKVINSEIQAQKAGIYNYETVMTTPNIVDCTINVEDGGRDAITIDNGQNPQIWDNTISIGNARRGVYLRNCREGVVDRNEVTLNSSNSWGGIWAANGPDGLYRNNLITGSVQGTGGTKPFGVNLSMSANSEFECNCIGKTSTGFRVFDANTNTNIRGTNFERNNLGNGTSLLYRASASTGTQQDHKNMWSHNDLDLGAQHQGNWPIDRYLVASPQGTLEWPGPDNSWWAPTAWFNPGEESGFSCGSWSCTLPFGGGDPIDDTPAITELDELIRSGAFYAIEYNDEMIWLAEGDLYEKLSENPQLMVEIPFFQAWYDNLVGSEVAKFYNMRTALYDALVNNEFNGQISQVHDDVEEFRDEIEILDSIIINDPNANVDSLRAEIESLHIQINTLMDDLVSLINQRSASVLSQAQGLLNQNGNLGESTTYQYNEKKVNDIYLNAFIGGAGDLPQSTYDELFAIANSCVLPGGRGVHLARALLSVYDEDAAFDDDLLCAGQGSRIESSNTSGSQSQQHGVAISPNPSSGLLIISSTDDLITQIAIRDVNGKTVFTESFTEYVHSSEISTNLNNGMYWIELRFENSIEPHVQKIVILK